jgi:hypothetical integral membrane protein (TIGR02206 family)
VDGRERHRWVILSKSGESHCLSRHGGRRTRICAKYSSATRAALVDPTRGALPAHHYWFVRVARRPVGQGGGARSNRRANVPISSAVTQAGRWDVFVPYSGLHLVSVAVCLALIVALVLLGRRSSKPAERRLRKAMAAFAMAVWAIYNTTWNWNGIDPRSGLPLHICDLGGLLAPFALLTLNRWLRATLYFWATALTTQAFIQPTLTYGPTSFFFWCFWIAHTIIFGFAIYDLAVLRFRPDWSDFGRASAVTLGYLAVIMPINIWLGANYAYIGNPASEKAIPPFVAALGPWPDRVIIIAALVGVAFLLALLPWRLRARALARSPGLTASPL